MAVSARRSAGRLTASSTPLGSTSCGSASMPTDRTSGARPTTAPRKPSQWVRLPTTPSGQHGSPLSPFRIGAGGTPSSPSARRAQCRTVTNSLRRLATERAISGSSSGSGVEIRRVDVQFGGDATSVGHHGRDQLHRRPLRIRSCIRCGMHAHLRGDHEVAAELVEVAGRVLRVGQHLPQPPIRLAAPPLSRITHRHLFEAHVVVPGGARDVQVAVHRADRVVAGVPVGGRRGAAPQRELGVEQRLARLANQREMVHQHRRRHPVELLEPLARVGDPVPAPRVTGGVRLRRQHELVGGHHVALPRDRQTLRLRRRPRRQERVVVQQEHRHDGCRATAVGPHRVTGARG